MGGNEVLRVERNGDIPGENTINLKISRGQHTIRVNWKEICCKASIGFTAPSELFDKGNIDRNQKTPGFGAEFIISIAIVVLLLKRRNTE